MDTQIFFFHSTQDADFPLPSGALLLAALVSPALVLRLANGLGAVGLGQKRLLLLLGAGIRGARLLRRPG